MLSGSCRTKARDPVTVVQPAPSAADPRRTTDGSPDGTTSSHRTEVGIPATSPGSALILALQLLATVAGIVIAPPRTHTPPRRRPHH